MNTLRSTTGDGFLYIDSPAGSAIARDGSTKYWIGLDEPFTNEQETRFLQDLAAKRLAYMFAKDGSGFGKWKYCFGAKFVHSNMAFSANSFVFLNTPLSGMAQDMLSEFHLADASVVMCWYANVPNDVSYAGAIHLIDRLLGANELGRVEDPPIRPFELVDTLFDMQDRGVSAGQPILYPLTPPDPYDSLIRAYNLASPFDAFSLFVPTIEYTAVNIDEAMTGNVLELYGDFGDTVGLLPTVLVDNTSLDTVQLDESMLRCVLPDSGAGSYGDVEVMVNGHVSNARQLTEWRGILTYKEVGPGSLTRTINYDLHFRADINSYRPEPDTNPLISGRYGNGIVALFGAPDSSGSVNVSGSYTDPSNSVITWSNAANTHIDVVYGMQSGNDFIAAGNLDMNTGQITFVMPTSAPIHEKIVNSEGIVVKDVDEQFGCDLSVIVAPASLVVFQLDLAGSSIRAGSIEKQLGETHVSAIWEMMLPSFAPDPNGRR